MRRELAEKLLAQLLEWTDAEKALERAMLDAFATYKYDEYQQFAPGLRFLESLVLWLRQFDMLADRRAAYAFVRERLIFISDAEMTHLVELAFPIYVRPTLIERAAGASGLNRIRIKQVLASDAYRKRLRQTLVLGLSDGARTDVFRRANSREISNEQVWHAYDISDAKAVNLRDKLKQDLTALIGTEPTAADTTFGTIVLLDDFTASGRSYIRRENDGSWDGKIPRIIKMLQDENLLGMLVGVHDVSVIVVIYVAAPQAIEHIERLLDELDFPQGNIEFQVVHRLSPDAKLDPERDAPIWAIALKDEYFDVSADDEHGAVGGASKRFGFADCALPIVLSHNTPNNSIFLLWAEDVHRVHGLFPRVSRHRKFV